MSFTVVSKTDLSDLQYKNNSIFKLEDLMTIIIFSMDEVKNQTSEDFHFDFTINGKINKKLEPNVIKTKIPLVEVVEQADCKFAIEDNNKANLNCIVNVEKYKEIKAFSFKTSEIMTEDNKSIYLNKLNEIALH